MVWSARLAFAIVDALFILVGIQQIYVERHLVRFSLCPLCACSLNGSDPFLGCAQKGALGDLQYFTPRLMVAAYCLNLITNVIYVIASLSDCMFCQNYSAFVSFGVSKDAATLIGLLALTFSFSQLLCLDS
jgi:hypothetical protein